MTVFFSWVRILGQFLLLMNQKEAFHPKLCQLLRPGGADAVYVPTKLGLSMSLDTEDAEAGKPVGTALGAGFSLIFCTVVGSDTRSGGISL
jgi:hypothetical protein